LLVGNLGGGGGVRPQLYLKSFAIKTYTNLKMVEFESAGG